MKTVTAVRKRGDSGTKAELARLDNSFFFFQDRIKLPSYKITISVILNMLKGHNLSRNRM